MAIKLKISVTNKVKEKVTEVLKAKINEKLALIYSEVVPLTPVGKSKKGYTGGRLRKGWSIEPATIRYGKIRGYLSNSVHYAGHVNYGHRTRLGMSMKKSKAKGKKYVEGRFFMEEALRRVGIEVTRKRWK